MMVVVAEIEVEVIYGGGEDKTAPYQLLYSGHKRVHIHGYETVWMLEDYILALQHQPVVASLVASTTFQNYVGDDIYMDTAQYKLKDINHAVLISGYGPEIVEGAYWDIMNSWGPSWGQNGFGKVLMGQNINLIETVGVVYPILSANDDCEPGRIRKLFGFFWHMTDVGIHEAYHKCSLQSQYALICHVKEEGDDVEAILKTQAEEVILIWAKYGKKEPQIGKIYVRRQSRLWNLPRFFIVKIVRYGDIMEKEKVFMKVKIPPVLDVSSFCSKRLGPDQIYDLVAILTHEGLTADSSTYFTFLKLETGNWIKVDYDSELPVSQEEHKFTDLVLRGELDKAYILMYQER